MIDEAKLKKRDTFNPHLLKRTQPIYRHETVCISYYLRNIEAQYKMRFKHEIYTLLNLFKSMNIIYHEKLSWFLQLRTVYKCLPLIDDDGSIWNVSIWEFDQIDTWMNSCWWQPTDLTNDISLNTILEMKFSFWESKRKEVINTSACMCMCTMD